MKLGLQTVVVLSVASALAACGGGDVTCLSGQVKVGGACFAEDASAADVEPAPDAAPRDATGPDLGPDAGPAPDAPPADLGPPDLGPPDLGPADTGEVPDAGGPPRALLNPAALTFGTVGLGGRLVLPLSVSNPGSAPVTVRITGLTGQNASSYGFSTTATLTGGRTTLAPGQSLEVRVRFVPTNIGRRLARLGLELCDGGCAVGVDLSGEAIPRAVDCTPRTLDFMSVRTGACSTRQVSCLNRADTTEQVLGFSLAAGSPPDFTVTTASTLPVTLAPRGSVSLDVRFCPSAANARAADLTITTTNPQPADRDFVIGLRGTGGQPRIVCSPEVLSILPTGVGSTRQDLTTCENAGTAPLLISSAGFLAGTTSELTVVAANGSGTVTFPASLAPGEAVDLIVTYAPVAPGAPLTSIAVDSDDPLDPNVLIPVSASAVDVSNCQLSFDRTNFYMGSIPAGAIGTRTILARSTGTTGCLIEVRGFGMGTAPGFSTPEPRAIEVPARGSYDLTLNYDSRLTQFFDNASLDLATTDPGQPLVSLIATATQFTSFEIYPDQSPVDFGSVPLGCGGAVRDSAWILGTSNRTMSSMTVSLVAGAASGFSVPATATGTIASGARAYVPVAWAPTVAGPARGVLSLSYPSAPLPIYFPIRGEAFQVTPGPAAPIAVVDTFPAQPARKVDILLVLERVGDIDIDSTVGARLEAALPSFFAALRGAGLDHRVGVTTDTATTTNRLVTRPALIDSSTADPAGVVVAGFRRAAPGFGGQRFRAIESFVSGQPSTLFRADAERAIVMVGPTPNSNGTALDLWRTLGGSSNQPTQVYSLDTGYGGCRWNGSLPIVEDPESGVLTAASGGLSSSACASTWSGALRRFAQRIASNGFGRLTASRHGEPGSVTLELGGVTVPARTGTVAAWGYDYDRRQMELTGARGLPPAASAVVRYTLFCPSTTCGNNLLETGERCEDNNPVDTDACPGTCFSAACGDGYRRTGTESCDDGNTISGDGCNGLCLREGCGDGFVDGAELCDEGALNSNTLPDRCRLTCVPAGCGDSILDTGEQCDDGNLDNEDGCTGRCEPPRCGDTYVRAGVEECDDGNTVSGDGCTALCQLEGASFTSVVSTSVPLAATSTAATTYTFFSTDDANVVITLPFSFRYQGVNNTQISVSTNGLVLFDAPVFSGATTYVNTALPATSLPNAMVTPWWDDLSIQSTTASPTPSISGAAEGTAPNRRFRLRWQGLHLLSSTSEAFNFEVVLYETTNVIDLHYGTMTGTPILTTGSASAGWESVGGTRGVNLLACSPSCTLGDWPTDTLITLTPR